MVSVVFAICLVIYMKRSKLGRAIRATAQNARAAKILGVDTEKVYAATFGINAALCGVAGALIAITFTLHPYVGLPYTVRSFMIVIIAGLGNLPGVALSGMVLGGLYTSTAADSSSGVPGAKRVPVVRWFTGNKEMKDEQKELLFFIIPTII